VVSSLAGSTHRLGCDCSDRAYNSSCTRHTIHDTQHTTHDGPVNRKKVERMVKWWRVLRHT
jgi:hypothetical protein